jgi:hypothetical protein
MPSAFLFCLKYEWLLLKTCWCPQQKKILLFRNFADRLYTYGQDQGHQRIDPSLIKNKTNNIMVGVLKLYLSYS